MKKKVTKKKAAGGRPTKYLRKYCNDVIEWGKEGMSLHEMALEMNVDIATIRDWRAKKPEFSRAVKRAIEYSQGWWEKLGRHGAAGLKDIQPVTYIFNMKNRFKEDWRDKQEIEQSGSLALTSKKPTRDELIAIINKG